MQWIDASAYWGDWSVRTPGVKDLGAFCHKMDALDIESSALTSTRALVDNTYLGNQEIADVIAQCPDRFVGVACINPMLGPEAVQEISLRAGQGFRALRLYPAHHFYTARDQMALDPVLVCAAGEQMPVYWTGCPAPGGIIPQSPLDGLETLARAHPGVQFIASAYNYREHNRLMLLLNVTSNISIEISTYHGVEAVREFVQAGGAHRVLLGTGYGIQYAGLGVGKVKTAAIDDADRLAVGRENARRLLRL